MKLPPSPIVLITGAGQRIGAVIAKTMHAHGYRVLLHCRHSREQSDALCAELNAERDDSAAVLVADLTQSESIKELAQQAEQHWGGVDVLVNNASMFYPTPVETLEDEDWDELLQVNLRAPFLLSQQLAATLAQREGCIVNIVDIHAERPLKGYTAYCVSKAGLAMLTKSLARELAPAVRCNGVSPGAILWPQHEQSVDQEEIIARTALKRAGCPDDIARTVLFLSKDAPYITGQIIAVDGGRTLSN